MLPSSSPPDNRDAICHDASGPNRNTHARAATAIASNASATSLPAGITTPSSGSSATAQRVKCALISSARSANLRSQPRTVSGYAPNRAAIRRNPSPATFASIASPITDTSSRRRENANSGNNTCVPKQPRHRARRGRNNLFPPRQRSTRSLACPHGPNTPRHDGHPNSPPTSSASTNATSAHTINIGVPPPASKRALPTTTKQTGGLSRVQNARSLPNPLTTTNGTITPARDQTQRRLTWQQRIRAVLYHHGLPRRSDLDLLTAAGRDWLTELSLSAAAREQITIALRMIGALDAQIPAIDKQLRSYARRQTGCRALMSHYGIGELTSVAILAELGDCRRFSSSRYAVRYGGLDITVHASDRRRAPGHLSRQGPPVLRWAPYEAAQAATRPGSSDHAYYRQAAQRLGHNRACLAIARNLLKRSYHTLKDLGDQALAPA